MSHTRTLAESIVFDFVIANRASPLCTIPVELWQRITDNLDPHSLASVSLACKCLWNFLNANKSTEGCMRR